MISPIEDIIDDIRQGKMVIIMDDEGRENEGDFVMAASQVRPEDINFMAKYGRGLICLPLTRKRCEQLNLPLMPRSGRSAHGTAFTVSIEAAEGVTTGISAFDRAVTVQAAVKPDAVPEDLVQPGHIFPLVAEEGGVLVRAGHTEAGCDLARLADLEPAAVIVEILNDDGSMARRPDLETISREHNIKMGTIEDLIRYRTQNETFLQRDTQCHFPTAYGDFTMVSYIDHLHKATHIALVKGELINDKHKSRLDPDQPTLVRVHVANPLYDTFAGTRHHGWPLADAMQRVANSDQGVVIVLNEPHEGVSLQERVKAYSDKAESPPPNDFRAYGVGAQLLVDLGVSKMVLMSAPKNFYGLNGFGLEIVDYHYENKHV